MCTARVSQDCRLRKGHFEATTGFRVLGRKSAVHLCVCVCLGRAAGDTDIVCTATLPQVFGMLTGVHAHDKTTDGSGL